LEGSWNAGNQVLADDFRCFGAKVAVATANRAGFLLAPRALAGNPYDGRTPAQTNEQILRITGIVPERFAADKGPRATPTTRPSVIISGRRRGLAPTMERALERRSAIEATIGHMETDGQLDRTYLLGLAGDTVNALLRAAGHNLRRVLNHLGTLLALILAPLLGPEHRTDPACRPTPAQT
jgi:IS5 family transposase